MHGRDHRPGGADPIPPGTPWFRARMTGPTVIDVLSEGATGSAITWDTIDGYGERLYWTADFALEPELVRVAPGAWLLNAWVELRYIGAADPPDKVGIALDAITPPGGALRDDRYFDGAIFSNMSLSTGGILVNTGDNFPDPFTFTYFLSVYQNVSASTDMVVGNAASSNVFAEMTGVYLGQPA